MKKKICKNCKWFRENIYPTRKDRKVVSKEHHIAWTTDYRDGWCRRYPTPKQIESSERHFCGEYKE